jgi:coenzyme PQQ precursor peptide PqqA
MAKSPRELVIDEVNKIRKEKESRKLETQYQEYVEKAAEATPIVCEISIGMEVTSYASATI